jgi:SPP1 family predicted phage head-tail adaptor
MRIRAGELRHVVVLQTEDKVEDGYGGWQPNPPPAGDGSGWKDVATVHASIQPLSGQEALVARQLQDTVTHKVVMRYRAGVTAKHRLRFGTRLFNIREVRNIDERNWKLELRCEEGVAQ